MVMFTGEVHFVTTPWIVIGLGKSTIGLEEIYRHQRLSKAQVLVAAGPAISFHGTELCGCVSGGTTCKLSICSIFPMSWNGSSRISGLPKAALIDFDRYLFDPSPLMHALRKTCPVCWA